MEEGAIIKHNIKKSPRTGSWRYMKPEVDKDKCIGCTTCVPFCPDACIEMKKHKDDKKKKADIGYEFCKGCGVCAQVCPVKAITMKKN
jgi:2-oxoacid:acceptor oxidoreductase delta subunit (pyruvate/2-ketoisovalerate family)